MRNVILLQGIKCLKKLGFFYFFALCSKTTLKIFPIFSKSAENNRAHYLSKIVFLKKFLILDYRGLSVQKKMFFFLLCTLLQNGSKDLPNFLHECRGQQGPLFEQDCFSEKILNPGLQGIKCPKKVFILLLCTLLLNGSKDLPNGLHECR